MKKPLLRLGLALMAASVLFFAMVCIIPFQPISSWEKAIATPVAVVLSSVTWYAGLALVGKEFIPRVWRRLFPKK